MALASICAFLLINGATQPSLAQQGRDKAQGRLSAQQEPGVDRQPLEDFEAHIRKLYQAGEIDLNAPFALTVEADRDAQGRLSNVVVTQQAGEAKYWQLATEFVSALSESRGLRLIKDAEHLSFSLTGGSTDLLIKASFALPNEEQAIKMADAYAAFIKGSADAKRGRDAGTILNNLKASSSGKQLRFDFAMPRAAFGALLSKYLSSN